MNYVHLNQLLIKLPLNFPERKAKEIIIYISHDIKTKEALGSLVLRVVNFRCIQFIKASNSYNAQSMRSYFSMKI